MSLRLQLVALAAAFVAASASATNLAEDCKSGLELLQGQSDFELAARCRASFSPEVCRQAGRTLGDQPWSSEHMDESCAHFAAVYSGTDARGLEDSMARKAATMPKLTPLEEATSQKKHPTGRATPTHATQQPREGKSSPGGLIRHLLDKVGDGKKAEEAEEAEEIDDKVESGEPPNDSDSKAEEPTDVQKEDEEGKEAKEAKEVKEVDDEAESAESPSDSESEAEEPIDVQKEVRVAVELDTKAATQRETMAPMSKNLDVAEKADSHPLVKTETDSAVELFGQLGLQLGQEGSSRGALPGLLLFAASAAFVMLAVLRRRRFARDREAFMVDLEQEPILE